MTKNLLENDDRVLSDKTTDEEIVTENPLHTTCEHESGTSTNMFGGLAGLLGGLTGKSSTCNTNSDVQPITYNIVKDNLEKNFDRYIIQDMIDMCYQDVDQNKGCLADYLIDFFKVGNECDVDLLIELLEHFETTITNEYNNKCGFESIDRGVEIVMQMTYKKLLYIISELKKTILDKTSTK